MTSLFNHPQFEGQYFIRPSQHDSRVMLVDRAETSVHGSLTWYAQDLDTNDQASAALAGFQAAQQHISSNTAVLEGKHFKAGAFTNSQFRHFAAMQSAYLAFPGRKSRVLPTDEAATLAVEQILDITSRPLANALFALNEMNIWKPRSKVGFVLSQQSEIQDLIDKAFWLGDNPNVLVDFQQGLSDQKLYGFYVGEWLAESKPQIFSKLESLSLPITDYLTRYVQQEFMQNNGALTQDYLGFASGTAVSVIEQRLQSLTKAAESAHDLGNTYMVSTLLESIPFDPEISSLLFRDSSKLVDAFQLAEIAKALSLVNAEHASIASDGDIGSLSSDRLSAYSLGQTQTRNWLFVEQINGDSVTPQALADLSEQLGIHQMPESVAKSTMRMG